MNETSNAPEPLTPPDCDLRDFGWMSLDVARLRDSELAVMASGDAFRSAILLWCASWHQVPAASLPSDNRLLANLAGYGRDLDGWAVVRNDALTGFIECSDGRLYHPDLAAKAIEADKKRKSGRKRTEAATSARRRDKRHDDCDVQRDDGRDETRDDQRNEVQKTRQDKTGTEQENSDAIASVVIRDQQAQKLSRFDEFWQAYPRRDGPNPRKPAETKFNALVKTGVDPEMLIAEAKKLADQEAERGNIGTRFIPQAVTWLNQQRWSDHAAVAMVQTLGRKENLCDVVRRHADAGIAFGPRPTGLPVRPLTPFQQKQQETRDVLQKLRESADAEGSSAPIARILSSDQCDQSGNLRGRHGGAVLELSCSSGSGGD